MYQFPIGVLVDCFRLEMKDAVKKSAELGAKGIQVYAAKGAMAPENLSAAQRREFLDMVKSNGLVISALCGDLGGGGFVHPEQNPDRIERSKRILDLAKDLETDVVTTHIGVVPEDTTADRYIIMQDACAQLAEYADSIQAHFAVETGPEPSVRLKAFLDSLHSTGVAVNLDPANLVMVVGDDPVQAVYNLKDYIVHTHAKDGKMLYNKSAEEIYDHTANHIVTGPSYIELPLGEGNVPWDGYLAALEDIGFRGFLTIEREVGDDPAADIIKAVTFLKERMA